MILFQYSWEPILVLIADCSSIVIALVHLWSSTLRSKIPCKILIAQTVIFILLPPFIPTLSAIGFLSCRWSGYKIGEQYAHYLAKSTAVINGTFEVVIKLCCLCGQLCLGTTSNDPSLCIYDDWANDSTVDEVGDYLRLFRKLHKCWGSNINHKFSAVVDFPSNKSTEWNTG